MAEQAGRVHLEMGSPLQGWGSGLFGEGMVQPPGWGSRRSLSLSASGGGEQEERHI